MFALSLSCFQCPSLQYFDHFTLDEVFSDDSPNDENNKDSDDNLGVEDEIFTLYETKNTKLHVDDVNLTSEDESLLHQEHSTSNS